MQCRFRGGEQLHKRWQGRDGMLFGNGAFFLISFFDSDHRDSLKLNRETFFLNLADRSSWAIAGSNAYGRRLAAVLAAAMGLKAVEKPHGVQMDAIPGGRTHELIIRGQTLPSRWRRLPQVRNGRVICSVGPSGDGEMFMVHILNISQLIASLCEPGGGFLLHGALVCRGDSGFVLMGGSGSGKTTASRRIPSPWRSSCDDYTLVLRDPAGEYWAHPWPTWSRFFQGGPGGSWPVKAAVRLGAIFFLQPAKVDAWSEATPHQPTVKIMEAVEQATWSTTIGLEKSSLRTLRRRRLENAIQLAQVVPAFLLQLTLHGKFWQTMENALASKKRRPVFRLQGGELMKLGAQPGLNGMALRDGLPGAAGDPFCTSVREWIAAIPRGKVATYGQIARLAGKAHGARQVSWILHSQSKKYRLPWQRVIGAAGRIRLPLHGGFFEQRRLLRLEGVTVDDRGRIDMQAYLWTTGSETRQRKKKGTGRAGP